MIQTTKTISFNDELQAQLEQAVNDLNKIRINGAITQSKIIRIAVAEYLEKLAKIKKINEEYANDKKSVDELLNGSDLTEAKYWKPIYEEIKRIQSEDKKNTT